MGYEMWVRSLETRVGSIVGASGCCYVIRRELHEKPVSPNLSRDFLSSLRAHEAGQRAVSVNEAVLAGEAPTGLIASAGCHRVPVAGVTTDHDLAGPSYPVVSSETHVADRVNSARRW